MNNQHRVIINQVFKGIDNPFFTPSDAGTKGKRYGTANPDEFMAIILSPFIRGWKPLLPYHFDLWERPRLA